MQRQVANSSHSSFTLNIFMPEPEKPIKNQILNQNFGNASDFASKFFRLVTFCFENFTPCLILNLKIFDLSGFELKILQQIRI